MVGSKNKSTKKPSSKNKTDTKVKTGIKQKKAAPKKAAPKKKAPVKKAAVKKAAPKKQAPVKKAAAKKAVPKKKAPVKKAAAKKAAPKKMAPVKKTAAKKAAPKKTASGIKTKKATPKKTVSGIKTKMTSSPKTVSGIRPAAKKAVSTKTTAGGKSIKKAHQNMSDIVKNTTKRATNAVKNTTKNIMNSIQDMTTVKPPFAAYNGIKPYLFCSYAHTDMAEIFKIIDKINLMGYRIWYDEGISPGIEWPEAIGNAIIKCEQYLVFMTPNAIASRNVRNEINLAYSKGKDLLVIFLEPTKLSGGMQLQLGTVHCIKKYELTTPQFFETLDKVLNSKMKN